MFNRYTDPHRFSVAPPPVVNSFVGRFRLFFEVRKIKKKKRQFEQGYGWVMVLYFFKETHLPYIRIILDSPNNFSESFDDGARAALCKIASLKKGLETPV